MCSQATVEALTAAREDRQQVAALIQLTDEQVAEATNLATATYERWQSARGHYRNTFASHRKGKLGEVAVETWGDSERTACRTMVPRHGAGTRRRYWDQRPTI